MDVAPLRPHRAALALRLTPRIDAPHRSASHTSRSLPSPLMRLPRTLVILAAALASCRGTERSATPGGDSTAAGGTIVIAAPEPDVLFPPMIQTASGRAIADNIYDRLAEIGNDMNTIGDRGFVPRLAERWDWSADSLSVAFHLNPRARWHDGQPVRAADVRRSLTLFKDPVVGAATAPLLVNVDSVSVRDSLTAVAWFHQRRPEQFYDFVYNLFVLPSHLLQNVTPDQVKTAPIVRAPVGTGRFRFVRWDAGSRVEVVADTANYRGRAKLDRVIWSPIPDFNTGLTQFMSGQADFIEVIPADQIDRVDSSATVHAVPYPGFQYTFLGFNLHDPQALARPHPVFGDRTVRLALSMALDRQSMLRNVFGSRGIIGRGPFPTTLATADTTIALPPFDTTRAKALLDSAGWKLGADGVRAKGGRPLAFRLLVPSSSLPRRRYAVLAQEQLKRVGARVEVEQLEFNTFQTKQRARDYDAVMASIGTDPTPAGAKQVWTREGIGGLNVTGYTSAKFDAELDTALASFDAGRAKAYARQAYQTIVDDAPAVWLYDVLTVAGAHRRIQVRSLRPDAWWVGLADWTIPPDRRIDRDRVGLAAGKQ